MIKEESKNFHHLISGSIASGLTTLISQPLDVIKTNMIGKNHTNAMKNPFKIAAKIRKTEGFFALWKGTLPNSLRVFPAAGVYFFILNDFKKRMIKNREIKELSELENFFVGAVARSITSFIFNPLNVLKTKFEYNVSKQNNIIKTAREIHQQRLLFSGALTSIVRDAPYAGIFYMFYRRINKVFSEFGINEKYSSFPSGSIAAMLAAFCCQPWDVLRTRIQLSNDVNFGVKEAFNSVWKNDGLLGFWSGIAPRLIKKAIFSGIGWQMYEIIVSFLDGKEEEEIF